MERPSAQDLCHEVAALKETFHYTGRMSQSTQERRQEHCQENTQSIDKNEIITKLQQQIQQKDDIIKERKDEITQLKHHAQQIEGLQRIIGSQDVLLQEKEQTIAAKQQEIVLLRQKLEESIGLKGESDGQIQYATLSHELPKKESPPQLPPKPLPDRPTTMHLPKSQVELLPKPPPSPRGSPQPHRHEISNRFPNRGRLKLKWKAGKRAPQMYRVTDAATDGDTIYFRRGTSQPLFMLTTLQMTHGHHFQTVQQDAVL